MACVYLVIAKDLLASYLYLDTYGVIVLGSDDASAQLKTMML